MKKIDYLTSGVDIAHADRFVYETIKPMTEGLLKKSAVDLVTPLGSFASYVDLKLDQYKDPVIAFTTDGVGTKIHVASLVQQHEGIGIDLVAMCVNDLVVGGAKPLVFLDYIGSADLEQKTLEAIAKGIVRGCELSGCALVGGETAQMPGHYTHRNYDLVGFAAGIAERATILESKEGKSRLKPGDVIIGIASSGLHSNGFSLVRKLFLDELKISLTKSFPEVCHPQDCEVPLWEILLRPTKIYVSLVLELRRHFNLLAMAHITGGGFSGNIPRILNNRVAAQIDLGSWDYPPLFSFIQKNADLGAEDMLGTFNCGVGLVVIVDEKDGEPLLDFISKKGEQAWKIGELITRKKGQQGIFYR